MTPLHAWSQQAKSQWQRLSPREQTGLRLLGGLLALTLSGWLLVAPALHTLDQSNHQRAELTQQHAHMLALQSQAQALQNRTPLARDEALRQLQSITPSAGTLQLQAQGERVTVQIKAVPPEALAQWLSRAREQAQALPLQAHLTRNNTVWDGSLVLRLPNRSSP